jgi:hypothetical protein
MSFAHEYEIVKTNTMRGSKMTLQLKPWLGLHRHVYHVKGIMFGWQTSEKRG